MGCRAVCRSAVEGGEALNPNLIFLIAAAGLAGFTFLSLQTRGGPLIEGESLQPGFPPPVLQVVSVRMGMIPRTIQAFIVRALIGQDAVRPNHPPVPGGSASPRPGDFVQADITLRNRGQSPLLITSIHADIVPAGVFQSNGHLTNPAIFPLTILPGEGVILQMTSSGIATQRALPPVMDIIFLLNWNGPPVAWRTPNAINIPPG